VESPSSLAPALALIELSSIGRGIRVLDVVAKKAEVRVHTAMPVSSGKYLLVFTGGVGEVEESMREGLAAGGTTVIHKLLLPNVHTGVIAAMAGRVEAKEVDALAIVELLSLATTVSAADVAAKAANVTLLEIRLGQGIGGKGFFTLTGTQGDVEEAVAAATAVADRDGFLAGVEVIPRPHADLIQNLTRRM
jgi:microcompartment protein CcmL/EutN